MIFLVCYLQARNINEKKKKSAFFLQIRGKLIKIFPSFLPTRSPDATYVKSEWLQEELTCLKITFFFSYRNILFYLFLAVKLNYVRLV